MMGSGVLLENGGRYITGIYALNLHHPEIADEPTGDWHGNIWDEIRALPDKRVTYGGVGEEIDTLNVWGGFGINDETEMVRKMGIEANGGIVFIADKYRAVLDLLYYMLKKHEEPLNMNGILDDWFDTEEQKEVIIKMITAERKSFTENAEERLEEWIRKETERKR
jgi:hypothetical protein